MKDILKSVLLFAFIIAGMGSCKKSTKLIDENTKFVFIDSANTANVKIVQVFAGNTPQLPTAATPTTGPQVFVYANGQKLNGASIGYGGVWPITAVYGNIPSGNTRFDIINGRLDLTVVPSVPKFIAGDTLASVTTNLEKGKFYSLYLTDTVPTMRVVVREDVLTEPEEATFKLRVANFSMNNNPTDTFSVFSVRKNEEIIRDVTIKTVSDWVQLPVTILSDTLLFRRKNTTTTFYSLTSFGGSAKRMYTIIGRGKTGVLNKLPSATFITNR